MSNTELNTNDDNDTGALSESVTSGRCPMDQQCRPGRHPVTAEQRQKRVGWSKEDNRWLFECYIRSEPERRGYRNRMLDLWKARNTNKELDKVSEQRLADQVRQIKTKKWLENVEQEEIALRERNEHQATNHNVTDASNREKVPIPRKNKETKTTFQQKRIPLCPLIENHKKRPAQSSLLSRDRILEVMLLEERTRLPSLRSCDRAQLGTGVGKVNEAAKRIETQNITELNSLMYEVAYVTTEKMGMLKKRKERKTEEPFWKRRIKKSIEIWRKDHSKIKET